MNALRKGYYFSVTFLLMIMVGYLIGLDFKSAKELNPVVLAAGTPGMLVVAVLVHELGHLLAGKLLGHTLAYLQIFFLVWVKGTPAGKPLWLMPRNCWGLCATLPPFPHQMSRAETAFFSAAGPLANLLWAGVLYATADGLFSEGTTGSVLLRIGCWLNLGLALYNLVPSFADKDTDGDGIWATLSRDRFNRALLPSKQWLRLLMAGVRPQDLPFASSSLAINMKAGDLLRAFYCALDRGEKSQADELMERLESIYPTLTSLEQQGVGAELLFWSCLMSREEKARSWRSSIKVPLDDSSSGLRILAYASWYLDQDAQKAKEYAHRALALPAPHLAPGMVPLDRDLIDQLLQQIATEPKQASLQPKA